MDREMRRMDPALYKAATKGSVASLRQLADPEDPAGLVGSTTPQLNTALHLSASHGHAEFVREVLDLNQELLATRNVDGDTPLQLAAKAGTLEVVKLLVGRALSSSWPPDKKSPLLMANKDGNNALHVAVRYRRSSVALALLDADPDRGHDLNERMETPLHMAAREGLVQVVRKMVEEDQEEFLAAVFLTGSPLHQAVLGNNTGIMEILLEKRPDLIDLTDPEGNNALHYAAHKDHRRAVEILLKKRTELAYKRNRDGMSPLHVAAYHGSSGAIKALLRHCPDVAEMVDDHGRNALYASVANGKEDALRCLLRHVRPTEAELLNRVDSNGDTPLHLAIKMSRVRCGLLLLSDRRVDPCVRDRDGQTARSILERRWYADEMDTYEVPLWIQLKKQESNRCPKQQLPPNVSDRRRPLNSKDFDSVVDAYFLAATLIATVTFAATFTMPGGYDQMNGVPLHGHKTAFKVFVVSNTVAMCSSIVVIFLLIWAKQEPVKLKLHNLMWSQTLTIVACFAMLLALMAAVYTTVVPIAPWPAYLAIAIGISSPALFSVISWMGC